MTKKDMRYELLLFVATLFSMFIVFSCTSESKKQEPELTKEQLDSLQMSTCDSIYAKMKAEGKTTLGELSSPPETLKESFLKLDTLLNPSLKEWIICLPDRRFSTLTHHGFGTSIRNKWGLWGGSKLAQTFFEIGVNHPDDMCGIILVSYQRRLKGEPILLDEQIEEIKDYYKNK